MYLDNNEYPNIANRFELLVGCSARATFSTAQQLQSAIAKKWLFGHLNYDFKNELYTDLSSNNTSYFDNNELHFFEPDIVFYIPYGAKELYIESQEIDPQEIWEALNAQPTYVEQGSNGQKPFFSSETTWETYEQNIEKIRQHIIDGDCYELNYCVAATASNIVLTNPIADFYRLNKSNPSPYAACYRVNDHWALCSSPERFLWKNSTSLLAQPMKGTIRRGADHKEDAILKSKLQNDIKERAENVMIADLMRNDLAKSSKTGTVKALELFGIYTFPTLHTMVSTIQGTIKDECTSLDAIFNAFPMGSMTGAPKKIVMEITENLEQTKRNLYAGSIGYFMPNGDFDFNVVIRTLLYDHAKHILSFETGGAITIDSIAEKEWAEVQLKAAALKRIFE
jgi:para-aminobenzoate synthetase component 1